MKEKNSIDKITRLGLVGALLLVAFSIFYYLVIYIPGKESQKVEAQKLETELAEQAEYDKKIELETCITNAEVSYSNNWNAECKSQGKLSASCIKLLDTNYEEYRKENNISKEDSLVKLTEYFKEREECSCRLPSYNSDRIEGWRKEAKDECYRKYE